MSDVFDHLGIRVADVGQAVEFYKAALAPLGITMLRDFEHEGERHVAFGRTKPDFWIGRGEPVTSGVHIAFMAKARADVDAFHRATLAAGGKDNGAPGLRPQYHSTYYGAFAFDLGGNNVEAVCHAPG